MLNHKKASITCHAIFSVLRITSFGYYRFLSRYMLSICGTIIQKAESEKSEN